MQLKIRVHPNSIKFRILEKEDVLHVYLESEPEKNKANLELIKKLTKLFDTEVTLVSGLKSRDKTVNINILEDEWNTIKQKLLEKR
ncbi:MAG: DUF167 domain-containing protein [Candidatus Micrarchaeota archaeon]